MNYKNNPWERHLSPFTQSLKLLKGHLASFVRNGNILILAGAVLVTGLMLLMLISFYQSTSQTETDAFNMVHSVQDSFELGGDRTGAANPLMQNALTGSFIVMGLVALGAVLVCLDRTRENLRD